MTEDNKPDIEYDLPIQFRDLSGPLKFAAIGGFVYALILSFILFILIVAFFAGIVLAL